jgi:hypothetical protein
MPMAASIPDQKAVIDAWLAEHPDEAERIEAYRRFGEGLRKLYDPVLEETVPGRLTRSAGAARSWLPVAKAAAWLATGSRDRDACRLAVARVASAAAGRRGSCCRHGAACRRRAREPILLKSDIPWRSAPTRSSTS